MAEVWQRVDRRCLCRPKDFWWEVLGSRRLERGGGRWSSAGVAAAPPSDPSSASVLRNAAMSALAPQGAHRGSLAV